MRNRGAWIAFLLTCFALTGLVGLFASYATSIPLERAFVRSAMLDKALATDPPDAAGLHVAIGPAAGALLSGPGALAARVAQAHAEIRADAEAEQRGVAARTRLMLGVVTVLAAALGAGILVLASRPAPPLP